MAALLAVTVSGQQPKRKPAPWVAPLFPAEPAWLITLPATPTADGAMDADRVYVPVGDPELPPDDVPVLAARTLDAPANVPGLEGIAAHITRQVIVPSVPLLPPSAMMAAINRETGAREWGVRLKTIWPPAVGAGVVFAAVGQEIWAIDAATGRRRWSLALDTAPRAPMLLGGNMLIVLTAPDELVGIRTDTRTIAWRRRIGDQGAVRMSVDDRAVYLATAAGRLSRVMLADGSIDWEQELEKGIGAGEPVLSEPAIARDRVLVGSTTNSFLAIDPESGRTAWRWNYRHIGGDVIGAGVDKDVVYMAALDGILRALNRGNGNQRWKREIGTRPTRPPVAFGGVVVVTGLNPTLSVFDGKTGAPLGTWAAEANTALQGPPLIDPVMRPFRTSIVVILRNGRVTALRSTAMLFKEPAAVPASALPGLPGRPMPREPYPGRR